MSICFHPCQSLAYQLVASDEDMERCVLVIANLLLVPELAERCTVLHVTPVRESLELGNEASDLLLPVVQRRCWGDDEERSPDVVCFRKICEQ